jgi:hypothetical protein
MNQNDNGLLDDSITYYTEQNCAGKSPPDSPLNLTLQMNFSSGEKNNRHRLGVRWRLNSTSYLSDFFKSINLSYAINLHAVQFDHEQGHIYPIEHTFMLKCPNISERLYLSGLIGSTVNNIRPAHLLTNPIVAQRCPQPDGRSTI